MELRIWGARGSYPASGARFSGFGHHTVCTSVSSGDDLVVVDAGTGAAALGATFERARFRRVHILLSHFHHDHMMGLPFLLHGVGGDVPLHIHAALGTDVALKDIVSTILLPPYFPGEATGLLDKIRFHAHAKGAAFHAGAISVQTCVLQHPGGAAAFRLEEGDQSLVIATDLEASVTPDDGLVRLAQGAGLLLHDTMFTASEAEAHRGWGHSTMESAAALGKAAGVRRLLGFHHHPQHDDAQLEAREADFTGLFPGAGLAREGQAITL